MAVSKARPVKSFRMETSDSEKLSQINKYYEREYKANLPESMRNLYEWTEAQTIALIVRERYEELLSKNEIPAIEE